MVKWASKLYAYLTNTMLVKGLLTKLSRTGKLIDAKCRYVGHRPEVPEILKQLQDEHYSLATMTTTTKAEEANELLGLLEWDKFFAYKEINPGSKIEHLKR